MDRLISNLVHGLNDEQIRAVTINQTGPVLVLAGAGCGKTTVLTKRIAHLIEDGIEPHRILALTFTRKAADEMNDRTMRLEILKKGSGFPLISTFHGLALKILSEENEGRSNFERIGFKGTPKLITTRRRLEMLAGITTISERKFLSVDLSGLDNLLACHAVFPERCGMLGSEKINMLETIQRRLLIEKMESSFWDFSDLISGLLRLFENNYSEKYTKKFKVVLVDEFQDTNPMQIRLLRFFISNSLFFAVGDDDQAIYGFRGADIKPTVEFGSMFINSLILKLQTNYRSTPQILNIANRIFTEKPSAYRKILVAGKNISGVVPSRHNFESQEKMADWIWTKAQSLAMKNKIPISSTAVLFRVNQSLEWMQDYLKKKYLPENPLQFLTIHGSKGLEFQVVFLCDLEEGVFPNYRIPDKKKIRTFMDLIRSFFKKSKNVQCDWDEEKRLFYVGITRAQKYLFFVHTGKKMVYGRKKRFEPSRFLKLVR